MMRQMFVPATCLLLGCAEESDLRLVVDDPSGDGPAVIALEHTAAVHSEPREVPGAVLPGGTVVFAAESPDICSTLQMGFFRGEEHFAFVEINEDEPEMGGVAVWGPDGQCEAWAENYAPVIADIGGDEVVIVLDEVGLVPKPRQPWGAARVTLEGSADVEVCPDVDVFALQCGVPVGS